tara:strand:+ start:246 stop:638 length:393 start_codon:yes stop_codon:yes gene_type:complete
MKLFQNYKYFTLFFLILLVFQKNFSLADSLEIDKSFKDITKNIRCMTCQNQSVYESETEFSKYIKEIVREKLEEGLSKNQIESYIVERYSEYILFKPRFDYKNFFLWISPFFIMFFLVISLIFKTLKRNK